MLLDLSQCFVGVEGADVFVEKRASDNKVLPLFLGCREPACTECVCCHSAETPSLELCSSLSSSLRSFLSTEDMLCASVTPQQDTSPFSV